MNRFPSRHRNGTGFSLLEVLVAVVVLSVGLLALAALQGALTRSSSEAKVRGRVAAMLTARMDDLRYNGYGNLVVGTTPFTSTNDPCGDNDATDWIDCTREQGALGSLSVQQVITVWFGAASFASSNAEQDPAIPQFKRIVLTSTWTDAGGVLHSQSIASDVSSMSLTNNIVIPPDPLATPTGGPIVRTVSPATAGVIPIAISMDDDGDADGFNATTNPVPELVGQSNNQQIVGTRFSVLNYTPSFGSSVVIQKRFDNEMVKCRCKFGAGGVNLPVIYQTAMWPAIWTGEGYELADVDGPAPGQTLSSGRTPGVEQSDLCQECCRDHHDDSNAAGAVRFDPERSDDIKYDVNPQGELVPVSDMGNGDYVNACRLIRVDGFWRTASDAYERQHGLLETQAVSNVEAKSGLPTTAAVDNYTEFVRDYLAQYEGDEPKNDNGQSLFEGYSPSFDANIINISAPSNTDYRFLHVRGLYVDFLEQEAREKLQEVIDDDEPQGLCPDNTPTEDCVMPFLPFTTVNLTELAEWTEIPDPQSVINTNERNLLSTTPAQPSGGRTIGMSGGTASAEAAMRRSNSGIAVSSVLTLVTGVDPQDLGEDEQAYPNQVLDDSQDFQVGAGNGPTFDVQVMGGGGNPFVFFNMGVDQGVECLKPTGVLHRCATSDGTVLPQAGTIVVSRYWSLTTVAQQMTATCGGSTATATVSRPQFTNYMVASATANGVPGTVAPPVNDITKDESTSIDFGSITQGGLVVVNLAQEGVLLATIASCTTNGGGNKINNIVWNETWANP